MHRSEKRHVNYPHKVKTTVFRHHCKHIAYYPQPLIKQVVLHLLRQQVVQLRKPLVKRLHYTTLIFKAY